MIKLNKNRKTGDYFLIIAVILLAIIGTVFIYSASNYSANKTYGDPYYFVKKQAIGVALGVAAMLFTSNFDYKRLKKFTLIVSIISFVLLALVFVPGIGVENYGAKRWIGVGGITLQPSEIAKFSLILFCATYCSKNPSAVSTFKGILPVLMFGGATCLLIIIEPNMSITVCVAMLMMTMLFSAGMKIKHFAMLIVPAFIAGVILILSAESRVI